MICATTPALAVDCDRIRMEPDGLGFTYCEVDASNEDIRVFHANEAGEVLGSFPSVEAMLAEAGGRLSFAMNAGMYHNDLSPVGLYIENGRQKMRLVTSKGPGNFGLLPNGVLCVREGRADVIESLRFEREATDCEHATQSGPMLVIDGELHPRFLKDGDSKYIRNGVGTSADGKRAVFVISDERVNFHTFGRFFRDTLNLPNALYFDGKVSRLYAPQLDRHDRGFPMGPIVGVVEPLD
ncbi:phosphodiester glycosidase family protein [Roseovarius sp. SCSIO 43702]|uniref:phosphodiester glycosidase family protein n=1 Tax=Roseovarius sp. SCSIO 43702 TaxID=2823043 RepID=UPI001C733529|nr:phosphodiester glycosidase family protein [Roseovarius sp. SCSIO 43702]